MVIFTIDIIINQIAALVISLNCFMVLLFRGHLKISSCQECIIRLTRVVFKKVYVKMMTEIVWVYFNLLVNCNKFTYLNWQDIICNINPINT